MILAKLALGTATTLVFATVYTFREGTVRVDVDEFEDGGAHVHVWAPAALVPMALHFVPDRKLNQLSLRSDEWLPAAHAAAREMRRYPNSTFVEVKDDREHVKISTAGTKIQVDVDGPEESVHVQVPLAMVDEVLSEIAARRPAS
jgi:hypothetical protein